MKLTAILIVPLFLLSGCVYVNERGIATKHYSDCKEYYDSMGFYHKECPENLIDKTDMKKLDVFGLFEQNEEENDGY